MRLWEIATECGDDFRHGGVIVRASSHEKQGKQPSQ
jgi:hypothetical protein